MKPNPEHYIGTELELFANARNWKRYWVSLLQPYLKGDVLEVGAGIGSNTELFQHGTHRSWTCLEPDKALAGRIPEVPGRVVKVGTLRDCDRELQFDAIIYIDVMEHIENDAEEARLAASHLRPNGALGVLSPAHMSLYSPFDKAIGHFRRYTTKSLTAIMPAFLRCEQLRYLDSVGLLASSANRLLLKQSLPTTSQIVMWDSWMVPVSRYIDPLLGYALGKSVFGIWTRPS